MNRTKKFLDGVVLNYGYQALVMTIGLWLTPFLLRHLGQHDYGVWLVGLQALTYLSLLDIGVIGLLPREVAFASGKVQQGADPSTVRRLIEDNVVVVLWQTPILLAAIGIALLVLRHSGSGQQGVLLIILATYGIQFPLRVFFAALEGLQDFAFLGYLQMAAWLAGVVANVTLVSLGLGLYGLAFGWTATQGIIAFGSIWRMYAHHRDFTPKGLRWLQFAEIRRYLHSGLWVSVSQITQMLIKGTDVVLIASLQGAAAVVPYSCSSKLQAVLANQPQVILQAAQPGLTQLRATADRTHIARVIGALAQAMLMLSGAVGCVTLALNQGFVTRWVGAGQYLGFWFTVLITVGMLVRHLNSTTVYTLFCFGKERFISLIGLADSVCFAVLMYVLVKRFGIIGTPIASIASVCLVSLPWNFRVLEKLTGLSVWEQLKPIREWFLPFTIVAVLISTVTYFYTPTSYIGCAIGAVLVSLVYLAAEYRVIQRSLWGERAKKFAIGSFEKLSGMIKAGLPVPPAKIADETDTP